MLYIFHSSPLDRYRVTVVAKYEDGRFTYATARCGRHDHFNRKKGVMIATGRLKKGKCWVIGGLHKEDAQNFVKNASILAEYLQRHSKAEFFLSKDHSENEPSKVCS